MIKNLFDLTGRVALITGGNGGIGLGMAEGLASQGCEVSIWGTNDDKNAAALETLEAYGPKISVQNCNVADQTDGSTALIFASRWGHRDSVRLLIEADADTDPMDSSGKSALQLATAFGHTAIIDLLRLQRRVCRSRQRLAFARGAAGSKPPLSPIEMLPYDLFDLIGEQIPLLSIEVAARVQKQRG